MSFDCEFCKKTFSTKPNFIFHQKNARYCLEIQGKQNNNFKCTYCEKVFTTQQRINEHISNTCKFKRESTHEEEINKLKEEFQEKLKEKDTYYQQQLKEKEIYISYKNEYITKLETKLDRLESTLTMIVSRQHSENESVSSQILAEEVKNDLDDEYSEYSKITLNNVVISSRPIDHYVNITQLCQAGEKKFNDWFRLDTTKELLNELASDIGIQVSELIESKRGNGNWIHPDLAIQLAQWISPKFAIQVCKWVRNLFSKGSVEIDLARLREKEKDIRMKENRIKKLENVCLSKQRRVEYPERNVIYMITTEDHLLRRTYIIGKAKNLTQRLSTYNKTCDHIVIHYRECKNEEDMDTAEMIVLNKLKDYREQANRDRFILPADKDEMLFIQIIDNSIKFLA